MAALGCPFNLDAPRPQSPPCGHAPSTPPPSAAATPPPPEPPPSPPCPLCPPPRHQALPRRPLPVSNPPPPVAVLATAAVCHGWELWLPCHWSLPLLARPSLDAPARTPVVLGVCTCARLAAAATIAEFLLLL